MSTRIDISVAQALLSQRVREIAEQNREQRLKREERVKEEAQIKTAADKATAQAMRDGSRNPGQAIGDDAAALDERALRLGLRNGVPEYYTPPKVAAYSKQTDKVAVGFTQTTGASLTVWSANQQASATATLPSPADTSSSSSTAVVNPAVSYYNNTFPLRVIPGQPTGIETVIAINGTPTAAAPVWEALVAGDNIYTAGNSKTTSVSALVDYAFHTLVLPINGTSFILAQWSRTQVRALTTESFGEYRVRKYAYEEYTYENPRVEGGFFTGEYDTITAVQPPPNNLGPNSWEITSLLVPAYTTYSDDSRATVEYLKCFVVGRFSCREISAPASLSGLFNVLSPPAVWVASTGSSPGYWDAPAGVSLGDAIRTRLPNGSSDAGIYKAINNPAGAAAASTPEQLAAFFSDSPRPSYAFASCQLPGTCTADVVGFDRSSNPDSESPLYRRYRYADVTTGPRSRTLLTAWDWSRPGYCRQKLLQLGFSPSDLQP